MTYYNDRICGCTRSHAFVPDTMSPLNNQPQYSEDALRDGPVIAGGDMGAYFPQVPAARGTAALYHEVTVPGLGLTLPGGVSIPTSASSAASSLGIDANSIIGPIVKQLEPTMNKVFDTYMPKVQSAVTSAVKSGIDQGVSQAWPTAEKKFQGLIEPYKKIGIGFGLVSVATLAGVIVLLSKSK
jgi:hypothetical protein